MLFRSIEQHQIGALDQRACDRGALLLAAGQLQRHALQIRLELEEFCGFLNPAPDLGRNFGATLTESEVKYLMTVEWARTAEDVVWRRSKLGLRLTPAEISAIDDWISAHRPEPVSSPLQAGGRS